VDFSQSSGPNGNHVLTVGSIAGAGTYELGADQLIVGKIGSSTKVSGPIEDGGAGGGTGGSLVKVGKGTLTLSGAHNTYSGGTTLLHGTLHLTAVGAAGTGTITFGGQAKLNIENAALSPGHQFGNVIDGFRAGDLIDLSGLHFVAGATANFGHNLLTVHSAGRADTLTLINTHGSDFTAVDDGHGGTEVMLIHA
jgi:autotransporter-associated beta strand protein